MSWFKDILRKFVDDAETIAKADACDVNNGIRTRNEVRLERGLPPLNHYLADKLTITTATGITPV